MPQVAIEKVKDGNRDLPVFEKIAQRLEAVQRRAFDLFEKRGGQIGQELDDWFKAEHEILGWPAAELTEKDSAYQVEISLPGFESKDVEVTATPTELIVHAATKQEKKIQKGTVLWTEFGSNDVYRRFELPNSISVDKVTANLENGLLKITAPEVGKPTEIRTAA